MDSLATRGYAVLDNAQVRLRASGVASKFTDLFELKADQSAVNIGVGERPTQTQIST